MRYGKGTKFIKSTATAYTKEGGVDIKGVLKVNAQSGYTNGTSFKFTVNKRSVICGTYSGGLIQCRGVRASKA